MKITRELELPQDKLSDLHKARVLEWVTIVYTVTTVVLMYLVMGSSQAVKTAWLEDTLGIIPPIVVLIAMRVRNWSPNKRFPFGYHRAVMIAYAVASCALLGMGLYLIYESASKLVMTEHPTIGTITLGGVFDGPIWLGWVMLPVLLYSALPAMWLGYAKLPLGRSLYNKPLYADAAMMKANWLSAGAAIVGIVLVGFGFWWGDSVAAGIIALEISHDGFKNLGGAVNSLMNRAPESVEGRYLDLAERIAEKLKAFDWVRDAQVRLSEHGQVFFGELFIETHDQSDLYERTRLARQAARELDWRMLQVTVQFTEDVDASSDLAIEKSEPDF